VAKLTLRDDGLFGLALAQARAGAADGGLPIGAALAKADKVLAVGRNRRVQLGSAIRHAEMDCLENAGRLATAVYAETTLYSTLSPCFMCSGAILQFGIPRLVVGADIDFADRRELLERHGVEVIVLDDQESRDLIDRFIAEQRSVWYEDIGAVPHEDGATDPDDGH
jgi:cytosine deaminase